MLLVARNKLAITGGRVIDPGEEIDQISDVLISNGRIEKITLRTGESKLDGYEVIDATGMIISPGFIDLHTHLRDPGQEWKETITS